MSRYRSSLIAGMAVITVGCGGDGPADPEPNPDAAGISVTPGALQFDVIAVREILRPVGAQAARRVLEIQNLFEDLRDHTGTDGPPQ